MKNKKVAVIGANKLSSLLLAEDDLKLEKLLNFDSEEVRHTIDVIKEENDFKYSHLTKKHQNAILEPVRDSEKNPKIGRNEKCPCGSDKKYKNCCGK